MDVATITMPPEQAKAKLKAFRQSRHKDAEEQYRQCAEGYKALAHGTPLINLDDVFRQVALDEKSRPKLAIARSDQKQVRFRWGSGEVAEFNTAFAHPNESYLSDGSWWRRVSMGRSHGLRYWNKDRTESWNASTEGFALIPMVPADVRPAQGKLCNLFTLWEVEQWSDRQIGARADRDPMLLKHVGGALYAVLAQWDLTDLERAILEGAATARQ